MVKPTKTLAEFYQSELEFHKAQKVHALQEIREIKRRVDLDIRARHKEIDKVDLIIAELLKLYNQEKKAETQYAKSETL